MRNVNMLRAITVFIVMDVLFIVAGAAERPSPERWQEQMDAFAKQDAAARYAADGVVFVGSSSIRLWDLTNSFPELSALNRGFGGSHIADSTHFLDLLVLKHKPRAVVFYAGDNDIASGLSPAEVVADYRAFVQKLQGSLPETHLVYIAIKPSVKRWNLYPQMQVVNQQIADIASADEQQTYLDIATPMISDKDAMPRADLFVEDGLHLNDDGYKLWSSILMPHLQPAVTAN